MVSSLSLVALGLGLSVLASATAAAQSAPRQSSPAGRYVPITPFRVLDTRSNLGGSRFGPDSTESVTVAGAGNGSIPATGVVGVVANMTVTQATSSGYLSVFPAGSGLPVVSSLNFTSRVTIANLVTVPVPAGGAVQVRDYLYDQAASQSAQVVMDIQGYYTTTRSGAAGLYNPITPVRIADTRPGSGQPDAGSPLGANGSALLTVVSGADGVPATATSVVLNVAAVAPSSDGYLTVSPAGAPRPIVSNVNFRAGATVANRVLAQIGANGQVAFYNAAGSTNIVVDVDGWYAGSSTVDPQGGAYLSVTPTRIVDTRSGSGGTTVAAAGSETFAVAGHGGIPATGALAAAMNVTVVNTQASGYLTIYPQGAARPTASDINWTGARQDVPNMTEEGLGSSGSLTIYNGSSGSSGVLIDVFGYFMVPVVAGVSLSANPTALPTNSKNSNISAAHESRLSATVTLAGALPAGESVRFTESGVACNGFVVKGAVATTALDSAAPFTATYLSGIKSGACVITATESTHHLHGQVTVTQS
ncbi:MAG TPA: hypothetical protein VMW47_03640 [Verrucomicrobiae bacterium]|nr:hypothetical protein [Verrucomicrobiae bacterium]